MESRGNLGVLAGQNAVITNGEVGERSTLTGRWIAHLNEHRIRRRLVRAKYLLANADLVLIAVRSGVRGLPDRLTAALERYATAITAALSSPRTPREVQTDEAYLDG